jgi:hypothetical protein
MSVDAEAREPDRYSWLAVDDEAVEVTCARIARHLSRAGVKVIGLLPNGRGLDEDGVRDAPGMAPLLASLAGALVRFVDQDVAIVDHWRTWRKVGTDGAPARIREIRPRVVEIAPLPCDDASAAGVALQNTLRLSRAEFGAILVNLSGYAPAGTAPSTLAVCDGVALVVTARGTRTAAVVALSAHVPSAKRLGVILVGCRP